MGLVIKLPHNTIVRTRQVKACEVLSTVTDALQVLNIISRRLNRNTLAVKYQILLPGGRNTGFEKSVPMRSLYRTASLYPPWGFHFGTFLNFI